MFLYYH